MYEYRPLEITPEVGEYLAHIGRLKAEICAVTLLPKVQPEVQMQGYAASAALHGARLDQYMRTVSG